MNKTNFSRALTFRLLAIGFIVYTLADLAIGYIKGGPEAPSALLLLLSVIILGGGAAVIGVLTYKQWKESQTQEEQEEQEEPEPLPPAEEEP